MSKEQDDRWRAQEAKYLAEVKKCSGCDQPRTATYKCRTVGCEFYSRPRPKAAPRAVPTIPRPKCTCCGKALRRYKHDGYAPGGVPKEWGDYGDNRFCGLRCGYRFALATTTNPGAKK